MLSDEKPNKKTIEISQLKGGGDPRMQRQISISDDLDYDTIYSRLEDQYRNPFFNTELRYVQLNDAKETVRHMNIIIETNKPSNPHRGIYYNITLYPRRTSNLPILEYVFTLHPTARHSETDEIVRHRLHIYSSGIFANVYSHELNLDYEPSIDRIKFRDKKSTEHGSKFISINYIKKVEIEGKVKGSLTDVEIKKISEYITQGVKDQIEDKNEVRMKQLDFAISHDVTYKLKQVQNHGEYIKMYMVRFIENHIEELRKKALTEIPQVKFLTEHGERKRREAERRRQAEAERRQAEIRREVEIKQRIDDAVRRKEVERRRQAEAERRQAEAERRQAEIRREVEIKQRIDDAVRRKEVEIRRQAEAERRQAEIRREVEIKQRINAAVRQAIVNTRFNSDSDDNRGTKRQRRGGYSKKYLKYKNKYIQLKKKLLLSKK